MTEPRKFLTIGGVDRREFLTWSGGLVSAAFLAACESRGPKSAEKLLRYAERKNLVVERALYRHTAMDKVQAGAHDSGKALPSYYISPTVPVWDESARGKWALEVSGLVANPMRLTLEDLQRLPRVSHRVNHYCVEGWTAVETWTGVPCQRARAVSCGRRRTRSTSISSHSTRTTTRAGTSRARCIRRSVVAYGLDGKMLEPAHGAPARFFSPIKLGYKNTKYLTKIVFMPKRERRVLDRSGLRVVRGGLTSWWRASLKLQHRTTQMRGFRGVDPRCEDPRTSDLCFWDLASVKFYVDLP